MTGHQILQPDTSQMNIENTHTPLLQICGFDSKEDEQWIERNVNLCDAATRSLKIMVPELH